MLVAALAGFVLAAGTCIIGRGPNRGALASPAPRALYLSCRTIKEGAVLWCTCSYVRARNVLRVCVSIGPLSWLALPPSLPPRVLDP